MNPLTIEELEARLADAQKRLNLMRKLREAERLLALESLGEHYSLKFSQVLHTGIALVCYKFDITEEQLLSRKRTDRIALPRQLLMWLCRELTDASSAAIGSSLGRDHGTVIHACNAVRNHLDTNPQFREAAISIRNQIEEAIKNQKASKQ